MATVNVSSLLARSGNCVYIIGGAVGFTTIIPEELASPVPPFPSPGVGVTVTPGLGKGGGR